MKNCRLCFGLDVNPPNWSSDSSLVLLFLSYSRVFLAVLDFVFHCFDACVELDVNPFLS